MPISSTDENSTALKLCKSIWIIMERKELERAPRSELLKTIDRQQELILRRETRLRGIHVFESVEILFCCWVFQEGQENQYKVQHLRILPGGEGGACWSTVYRCVNKGMQNLL